MKSKLTVIAALVSISFTGLPASGQSAEAINRARMIGFLSKGECLLKTGSITQETFEGVTNIYLKDNPELKPIYKWVTTSTNGKAGLIAMGTHYDSDCEYNLSTSEAGEVILPYVQ